LAGSKIDSGISGALNSTTPLFTLLVGVLFYAQTVKKQQVYGLLLGFIGALCLIFAQKQGQLSINAYAFCIILATLMYGFNLNIVKKHLNNVPSLLITTCLLSTTGPIATAVLFHGDFLTRASQPEAFWPLVFSIILGVVGTGIATVIFNKVLQLTTAVFASSVTYLIPIVAILWGLADGEKLQIQHIVGMLVILVGVYLVNKQTD
jgi:drug/metabolite transporter (DMT)-like permease